MSAMRSATEIFPTFHRMLPAARIAGRVLGWLLIGLFALATAYYVLTIALGVAASSKQAEHGVRFTKIAFNPKGEDTGTNKHLNREYIVIRNDTNHRKNIGGWMVRDFGGKHVYEIQRRLILGPDDMLRLHTGRGGPVGVCLELECNGPVAHYRYWGLDEYVWDNDRDRARLVRPDGSRADRCGYGLAARSPKRC